MIRDDCLEDKGNHCLAVNPNANGNGNSIEEEIAPNITVYVYTSQIEQSTTRLRMSRF
jgi:hypothetical protein